MPSIEDWINSPLGIIQHIYDGNTSNDLDKVKEYFSQKLSGKEALTWVPSLNDTPLHNLQTNTLVRFRCMIQDMFDPEFYLGAYQVKDKNSGKICMKSGKFKDIAQCKSHEEILIDSPDNITLDRQNLYCVPVPGENSWVKENHGSSSKFRSAPSTSFSASRSKRILEEESSTTTTSSNVPGHTGTQQDVVDMEADAGTSDDTKKSRTSTAEVRSSNSTPDLNFPLPGEKGPACLVKVYESEESFKVNEVVEFIGVLSNDPAMVSFPGEEKGEQSSFLDPTAAMEGIEEESVHSPPPSLVPRLHVILANRLKHVNPLLPADIQNIENKSDVDCLLAEGPQLREHLISVLQQALFGDKLTAEFTLCHLVSTVYSRHDMIPLGKFSLNMTGCPRNSEFTSHCYKLIQELVAKSYRLEMTIDNMNKLKFSPKKDYTKNRLTSGVLQLSDNTHLVLDETSMQPGQLDANGVRNLTALGNVARWQKVEYDFSYHSQDFESNVPILVLSEGKSLLTCDCRIPLNIATSSGELETHFRAIDTYLTPALKAKLRSFLTLTKLIDYQLPDDLQKIIEDDFVTLRRDDPQNMTVDDFHSLLILARLLCLSYGKTVLTRQMWDKAKSMEVERKCRLSGASGGAA